MLGLSLSSLISRTKPPPEKPAKAEREAAALEKARLEERNLLCGIPGLSGRSIADWVAAITAQNFKNKNDTIDWLRRQGFPFAWAAWLERVQSNGGRPLFVEPALEPAPEPTPRPTPCVEPTPSPPRGRLGAGIDPTRKPAPIAGLPPRKTLARADSEPAAEPTPTRLHTRMPGPIYISSDKQARALLEWLWQRGVHGWVRSQQVQDSYRQMVRERDWVTHNWNQVGMHFGRMVGAGRYKDFNRPGRKRERVLAFDIPKPKQAQAEAAA